MDPLSFTASIMTVSGVVAASTKIIYNLRDKFKDAPKDIESLMEQLQAFKDLLKELEAQVQDPPKTLGKFHCANAAGCEQLTYRSLQIGRTSQEKVVELEDLTSSLSQSLCCGKC